MTTLLAAVATATVLLALLAGCAAHLTRPATLPTALRAHRTVPARTAPVLALAVTAAEGVLGLAGTATVITGNRTGLAAVLAASALLFGTYALYVRHVLASGHGGPCGCGRAELPLSGWVTVRAGTLALLAAAGALTAGPAGTALPTGGAELAVAAPAALTFAILLWTLPAALHDPAGTRAANAPGGPPWTS